MDSSLLSGWIGIVIVVFGFVWGVLMFFAPFFWYETSKRSKEVSQKLDEMIALQRKTPSAIALALKDSASRKPENK